MKHLLVGPHPRQPQKGPLAPNSEIDSTFVQGTNTELLRSIQLGHQSSEGDQGGVL